MKLILLNKPGVFAKVSDHWFDALNAMGPWTLNRDGYAVRIVGRKKGFPVYQKMHDVVKPPPYGFEVDHENRDRLDNQEDNLRYATRQQQCMNSSLSSKSTSGLKGVCFDKSRGKWVATIKKDGCAHNLGRFPTALEAAQAYDRKAVELFGEFAATNEKLGLLN